jgi:hypothetical protein
MGGISWDRGGSCLGRNRAISRKILGKGIAEVVLFMHRRGDIRYRAHVEDPSCRLIIVIDI